MQYFQNQKFLDCTLLVEGHLLPCHKFVLDSCSDYFASFLKDKILDDKNLVICLPNEIKLWEMQALLVYMYNGSVAIEQEGLQSLVKCAELLQIKGLCGNESNETSSTDQKINENEDIEEVTENDENHEQIVIKKEVNNSDLDNSQNDEDTSYQTGKIRVKSNLFENDLKTTMKKEDCHEENSLNKSTSSKENEKGSRSSSPMMGENSQQFENIVCSPSLMQYNDDIDCEDDDDVYIEEEANVCSNEALFQMITQKLGNCQQFENSNDNDSKSRLMIASVSSQFKNCAKGKSNFTEKKVAIGGLYLRNPRGNQERKYDVNALYSALQDVKNGHSIYRAAQTYR